MNCCNVEKWYEFNQGSDLFSESPAVRRHPTARTPPDCHIQGRSPAVADVPPPAFVQFTQTPCQYPFQHGSDLSACLHPRKNSQSSPPRDIFRAVSQILSYIGAYKAAQPAVVQAAGFALSSLMFCHNIRQRVQRLQPGVIYTQ